jgi:predicted cupin superfamily sugar epimerase
MIRDAQYWIKRLKLAPHPEGGYFRESYRSDLWLPAGALPAEFSGARRASYAGGALLVHELSADGSYTQKKLGSDPEAGEELQVVVEAGRWFASSVCDAESYALVGCTVAPGFDFADFEMAKRDELVRKYPQHQEIIMRWTRG